MRLLTIQARRIFASLPVLNSLATSPWNQTKGNPNEEHNQIRRLHIRRRSADEREQPCRLSPLTARNSRARGMLFYRLLQQAVDTDPHPLKELIGGG